MKPLAGNVVSGGGRIRSGFTQGDFFGLFSSPGSRSYVVIAPEPVRGGLRASYRC